MIAARPRLVSAPRDDRQPVAPVIVLSLLLAGVPGIAPAALIAGFAAAALLVAAEERRDRAMLAAAGIALGLGPVGWSLAPLAIGIAIRRRRWAMLAAMAAIALLVARVVPAAPVASPLPDLTALARHWPDLFALVVAGGCGLAAWLAAAAREGRVPIRTLALAALLGGALFTAPAPLALVAPLVLLASRRTALARRPRAANDDAPVRATIRLAA